MTSTILVTGGTGTLGREIAQFAERAGHTVRIGSRRARPTGRDDNAVRLIGNPWSNHRDLETIAGAAQ